MGIVGDHVAEVEIDPIDADVVEVMNQEVYLKTDQDQEDDQLLLVKIKESRSLENNPDRLNVVYHSIVKGILFFKFKKHNLIYFLKKGNQKIEKANTIKIQMIKT